MRTPLALALVVVAPLGCGAQGPTGIEGQCDPEAAQAAFLAVAGEEPHHDDAEASDAAHGLYFAEEGGSFDGAGAGWEDPEGHDDAEEMVPFLAAPARQPVTLFLNRDGGTYESGASSSSANRSPIVPCDVAELQPYAADDEAWSEVVECVAAQFAPFDVEVTDEEPSSGRYIEVVVGDEPGALGLPRNVGGIAPMDTYGCRVIDQAVVFVFAERIGVRNTSRICEVAAQEVGHALGLDHEFLCEDPMSYLKGCGDKVFQNIDARCGEHETRDCACGRDTQNSVQVMARTIGTRDGSMPPPPPVDEEAPRITVLGPTDGAELVADVVRVTAKVDDDVSVSRVELVWEEGGVASSFVCPTSGERALCRREGDRYLWQVRSEGGAVRFQVRAQDPVGHVAVSPTVELDVEPQKMTSSQTASQRNAVDPQPSAAAQS